MKNKIVILNIILLLFMFYQCDEKQNKKEDLGFEINANIVGFPDSIKFYLKNINTSEIIDSQYILKNNFSFLGSFIGNVPEKLWLHTKYDNKYYGLSLLISNDKVNINGSIDKFSELKISGSIHQDKAFRLKKATKFYTQKFDSLGRYRSALSKEEKISQKESILKVWKNYGQQYKTVKHNYIKNNLNSYSSIIELGYNTTIFPKDTIKKLLKNVDADILNSKYGQIISTYINHRTVDTGEYYYDFNALNILTEKNENFSECFKNIDKYTILNFSSVECPYCIKSLEELKIISKDYNNIIQIVSYTSSSKEKWKKRILTDSLDWKYLWKDNFVDTAKITYQISTIPSFVIIDTNGIVIDKITGYSKNKIIDRLKSNTIIE